MEASGQLRWRRVVGLDGGEWSASSPRRRIAAKHHPYPLYVSQSPSGLFEEEKNPLHLLGIKAQFLLCLGRIHHCTDLRCLGSLLQTSNVLSSVVNCTFTGTLKYLNRLFAVSQNVFR